ncbi:MAG: signal recognition particle-docking protein FtsY [Roseovarius sp.]|uniref:signal recognition particle-docking protein FtsY n=1 Tax=Roseovarius sp. TaxID=1486281 RepID=UPI0032EE7A3F
MAFFSKLKERLFKSSSKLEEGLDAIVEDGGEEEAAAPEPSEPREPPEAPPGVPEPDLPEPSDPPQEAPEPDLPKPAEAPPEAPQPDQPPVPDAPREDPQPDLPPAPGSPPETPEPDLPEPTEPPQEVPTRDVPPARDVAPEAMPAPIPEPIPEPLPGPQGELAPEAAPRPGLLNRLFGRGEAKKVVRRALDDDMLEQLEELLITADMGVDTALRVTANMAEGRMGKRLSSPEIKELLATEIARIMEPVAKPMPLYPNRPQVVLVVGVNGSGKTTTIGKLASQFKAAGKSVVIAAGDTFRAAAVEQLQIWGDRAGVPVLTAPEGSDPASLAWDAMDKAQKDGADLLMIDTAGRLQNRADLMEELAKIVRVIRKKDESAPHNTLLVLDATTGQNALSQVQTFQKLADVSGLVMTKLDGTAKGGVLVALADKFGLPIHAIGVGEQIDDLAPFDPEEFAAALTGLEAR